MSHCGIFLLHPLDMPLLHEGYTLSITPWICYCYMRGISHLTLPGPATVAWEAQPSYYFLELPLSHEGYTPCITDLDLPLSQEEYTLSLLDMPLWHDGFTASTPGSATVIWRTYSIIPQISQCHMRGIPPLPLLKSATITCVYPITPGSATVICGVYCITPWICHCHMRGIHHHFLDLPLSHEGYTPSIIPWICHCHVRVSRSKLQMC